MNYQVGLQPGDEPVTVTDAEALKAHAAIPSLHKVKPPKNAEGGFTDPRLPIFNLIFDQNNNEDGLVVSNSGKMTGVDTDFDVSAAFTTAKPGYGTPPCVEMLLNAIKQKDENTPYRIDDATLSDYEQSAASKLTISLRGMSSELDPIFIIVPCPSSSMHTRNLANAIQQRLAAGSPREGYRPERKSIPSFTFVDILKKVTYGEAAEKIIAAETADEATRAAIRNSDEAVNTANNNVIIARNALDTIKKDRAAVRLQFEKERSNMRGQFGQATGIARDQEQRTAMASAQKIMLDRIDRRAKIADDAFRLEEAEAAADVAEAEAAMAGSNEQRSALKIRGHVAFNPNLETKIRHNALHEIWNNIAAISYDALGYFMVLKPTPNWLIMAARSRSNVASSDKLLAEKWKNIIKFALDVYAAKIPAPLTVDLVLEGLCDPGYINENDLDANGPNGDAARGFLADLLLDTPQIPNAAEIARKAQLIDLFSVVGTTTDSWSLLSQKAQDEWQRAAIAVWNAARAWDIAKSGSSKIEVGTMTSTYKLPFDKWVAQNQSEMNSSIIRKAEETPDSGFSISKVSAQSGNRKHTEGYIVDNEAHNEQAVFDQVQAEQRPYVLVIVDDNVESGTSMREAAKVAKAIFRAKLGAGPLVVVGATALAIRDPTVRCSSITKKPKDSKKPMDWNI